MRPIWWPQIFDLHYSEAKILTVASSVLGGRSDLKFWLWRPDIYPQLWYQDQFKIPKFNFLSPRYNVSDENYVTDYNLVQKTIFNFYIKLFLLQVRLLFKGAIWKWTYVLSTKVVRTSWYKNMSFHQKEKEIWHIRLE